MLTSSVLFSAILSNAISSCVASFYIKPVTTTTGLSPYWSLVLIGLMLLLYFKEVLAGSEKWNSDLNDSFNIAIIPLTISFFGIAIFVIISILKRI